MAHFGLSRRLYYRGAQYKQMEYMSPITMENQKIEIDVRENAHGRKKGLTQERMFDIIYRTSVPISEI